MTTRPKTLKEIAEHSQSLGEFVRHLRDWLHELRRASSRAQAEALIADAPTLLKKRFPEGFIADAWLGAYAEHLAQRLDRTAPAWTISRGRVVPKPIFDKGTSEPLRALALGNSPPAFRRRNLFTPSADLPLRLRTGRPAKSIEEKRNTNADRQRRFRETRKAELAALRKQVKRAAE